MLNLTQMTRRTDKRRVGNATYVVMRNVKTGHWKSGPDRGLAYIAAQTSSTHVQDQHGQLIPNPDKNTYVTAITFVDRQLNVKASCSCPDYLFRWEWANWNRKAADIEYSNGDSPDITNPTYKPSLCKHLVALAERIMDKLPPPRT